MAWKLGKAGIFATTGLTPIKSALHQAAYTYTSARRSPTAILSDELVRAWMFAATEVMSLQQDQNWNQAATDALRLWVCRHYLLGLPLEWNPKMEPWEIANQKAEQWRRSRITFPRTSGVRLPG